MASTDTRSADATPAWGEGAVTRSYSGHENAQMDFFGWLIFLVMLVVMLPLLPLAAVVFVVLKLADVVGQGGGEPRSGEPGVHSRR